MSLSKKELIKSRERKLQLAAPFHRDKQMVLKHSKKFGFYFWVNSNYSRSKFTAKLLKGELDYIENGHC